MPRYGCVEHGLKYIMLDVEKHIAYLAVCSVPPTGLQWATRGARSCETHSVNDWYLEYILWNCPKVNINNQQQYVITGKHILLLFINHSLPVILYLRAGVNVFAWINGLVQERHNFIANALGLVQEWRNSIANALELHLSCTNPLKWWVLSDIEWYYDSE